MNLSLRAKLRLPTDCGNAELQAACNRYYAIYKGVLESSAEESVKEIARNKLDALIADARAERIELQDLGDCVFSSQSTNLNADVEAELASLNGATLSAAQINRLNAMIDKLPESPKRYYLSALVILRSGETSTDSYAEAIGKLKSAAASDPENPVYMAMIGDIEREMNRYRHELTVWQDARQKEIDRQRRNETIKEVLSGIGGVLLWILGAILTIGGGIIACMCSVFDAC